MSRKLMLLAALPLLFAGPALAQSSDQEPAGTDMVTPPAASETAPSEETGATGSAATDEAMPSDTGDGADASATTSTASGDVQIMTEESPDQILVARIIGTDVLDSTGKEIGSIDDVVLDSNGTIAGLVLSSGAILGLGGKTVAITWDDVMAAEGESITIPLTEEEIAAAPEFRTKEQQEEEAMSSEPAAGGTMTTDPGAGMLPEPTTEPTQ